jgi:formamidopyrimidine-DNA glycosylase
LDGASSNGVPELPETETIARDLDREVAGARIVSVSGHTTGRSARVSARDFSRRVSAHRSVEAGAARKLVVIDLTTGDRLVVQPRFTGALLIDRAICQSRSAAIPRSS